MGFNVEVEACQGAKTSKQSPQAGRCLAAPSSDMQLPSPARAPAAQEPCVSCQERLPGVFSERVLSGSTREWRSHSSPPLSCSGGTTCTSVTPIRWPPRERARPPGAGAVGAVPRAGGLSSCCALPAAHRGGRPQNNSWRRTHGCARESSGGGRSASDGSACRRRRARSPLWGVVREGPAQDPGQSWTLAPLPESSPWRGHQEGLPALQAPAWGSGSPQTWVRSPVPPAAVGSRERTPRAWPSGGRCSVLRGEPCFSPPTWALGSVPLTTTFWCPGLRRPREGSRSPRAGGSPCEGSSEFKVSRRDGGGGEAGVKSPLSAQAPPESVSQGGPQL